MGSPIGWGQRSAQERGTRAPFFQFLRQTRGKRCSGGRLARAAGAEQPQVAATAVEKVAHPLPGPIEGRKRLIVRVFGAPDQLLDIGRNAAANPAWSTSRIGVPLARSAARRFLCIAMPATTAAAVATIDAAASPSHIVSAWSNAAPAGIARIKGTNANDKGSGSE